MIIQGTEFNIDTYADIVEYFNNSMYFSLIYEHRILDNNPKHVENNIQSFCFLSF